MSYLPKYTSAFKKDFKRIDKRGYNVELLEEAVEILLYTGTLPAVPYKTHLLRGNYQGYWEAHISPDWLIIWKVDSSSMVVYLTRTGTHSDLFG